MRDGDESEEERERKRGRERERSGFFKLCYNPSKSLPLF